MWIGEVLGGDVDVVLHRYYLKVSHLSAHMFSS